MKKIALIAAMAAALASSFSAQAATVTSDFVINITLTANCTIQTAQTSINFAYASFQSTDVPGNTGFAVRCTNGLPYSLSLDRAVGDSGTGNVYSYLDASTGLGYALTLSIGGGTGNALQQFHGVLAVMPGNQSGNCATFGGVCSNAAGTDKTRTITVTY